MGAEDINNDSRVAIQTATVMGQNLSTNKIPLLTKNNYQSWRDMIELFLEIKGLKVALLSSSVDAMIDMNARLILMETMDESHRSQVRGCSSAKEMYDRLKLVYADTSAANVYRLLNKYYHYKKPDEDTVSEHIGKVDEMRRQLEDLDEKQSERLYQVMLINSLPEPYHSTLELWELTHPEMRTTQNLVARPPKREEDVATNNSTARAMIARSSKRRLTFKQVEDLKKKTKCHACGEIGHWASDQNCPKYGQRREKIERTAATVIYNLGTLSPGLKSCWIADSGATQHMCSHLD